MKQEIGLRGYIKVWITRINGKKELVFEDHNAVQSAYANAVVDALDTPTDYAFNSMFNGNANPPPNGEDGIAIKDAGGLWYEMDMSSSISGGKVTFAGTFTGAGITVANAASVNLGHNYNAPFTNLFALPSSWTSQAVGAAEILTIEWILEHTTV